MNGIDYIEHHGVKGQLWGRRRYQNPDGSLTELGRRRLGYGARKAGEKKKKLLSNPRKAAKKSGFLSTKDLKSAIEKAELANKLRELNTTAKEQARSARLSTIERLSDVMQKARLNKQEVKKQKEQAEINRQAAKAKEAENKGKASAEKWKNRATKLKSIVDVGKALKTLSDDAGLTNKKSGETILGGILAGMGLKSLDKNKDKDDDNKKDSNKSSNPVINITNVIPGGNQNASAVQSAVKTVTQTVTTAPISTAKSINTSSKGVFSFEAPNKASSIFDVSSFKDVDFATIGGKAIPLFNWDAVGSGASWDTVKARRKDGQPDRRYKALEYTVGSRWSDELNDALIHGELAFDDMLTYMGDEYIEHHGVKNQKWGVRRYQNPDGSLTELGKRHRGAAEEALTEQVRKSGANAMDMWYQYRSARRNNKAAKVALRRRKLRDAIIHPFKTIKGQDTEKAKEIRRIRDSSAEVRDISKRSYKKFLEEGQLANKTLKELRKLKKKDKAVS